MKVKVQMGGYTFGLEMADELGIREAVETFALDTALKRGFDGIDDCQGWVRWSDGREFGPFDIDFGFTATAKGLRQNGKEEEGGPAGEVRGGGGGDTEGMRADESPTGVSAEG